MRQAPASGEPAAADGNDAEIQGQLMGSMTAIICKTRVVQVDDPLIEVYRLALAHGAQAEHLCDILKMIQERDHV